RNGIFPMTPAGHRLRTVMERDYDKTALLTTIDLVDSVWAVKRSGRKDWWRPFCAMGNVWYRAEYRPFDAEKKRVHGRLKTSQPIQFTPTEHYPRYYFADEVVQIADRHQFADELSGATHGDRAAFIYGHGFKPAQGVVRGYRETANTAQIEVDATGDAFLVMSVTPHKYWRVTIDGKRVTPVVANLAYQGVRVPAGRHRVAMRYVNDLVRIGGTISVAAIAILLAVVILARRR
ncbi:MAG TPA: YfhO family protein, partial [Thermoanaerobaculia bacterium]|nr:YfhO family protein [Thermoanaerobaculia bacterium]